MFAGTSLTPKDVEPLGNLESPLFMRFISLVSSTSLRNFATVVLAEGTFFQKNKSRQFLPLRLIVPDLNLRTRIKGMQGNGFCRPHLREPKTHATVMKFQMHKFPVPMPTKELPIERPILRYEERTHQSAPL